MKKLLVVAIAGLVGLFGFFPWARPSVSSVSSGVTCQAPSSGANFIYVTTSAAQDTNKGQGDHVKFDVVNNSSGSNITLDRTTAYTNALGAASIGRFTLAAGHSYTMLAYVHDVKTPAAATTYSWRRVSDGFFWNPAGLSNASPAAIGYNTTTPAIVTTTVSEMWEVCFTLSGAWNQIGEAGDGPDGGVGSVNTFPSATIIQID